MPVAGSDWANTKAAYPVFSNEGAVSKRNWPDTWLSQMPRVPCLDDAIHLMVCHARQDRAGDGLSQACRNRDVFMKSYLLRIYALPPERSEEHTSELQSLMRTSYAVFCLKYNKSDKN